MKIDQSPSVGGTLNGQFFGDKLKRFYYCLRVCPQRR
jgi:hypothetical protein